MTILLRYFLLSFLLFVSNLVIAQNAPIAVNDTFSTIINTPITEDVSYNDIEPDGDMLIYNTTPIISSSHGAITNLANGSFVYTPNLNYQGIDSFVYEVCDNEAVSKCDTAIAYIHVNLTSISNKKPFAIGDINNSFIDTFVVGNLLINDFDLDGNNLFINTSPVSLPLNGIVSINADGSYVYAPSIGFEGTDQFQYVICDDGTPALCDTAWCTIQVFDHLATSNKAPIAHSDYVHMSMNRANYGNLLKVYGNALDNDFDINLDNLTANTTPILAPLNGTFSISPSGNYLYIPNSEFIGTDTITYAVCDNNGLCQQANIIIEVIDQGSGSTLNSKPCSVDDAFFTKINTSTSANVIDNDKDVDSLDNLIVTIDDLPSNGTLVLNPDGTFVYIPNSNFVGQDQFIYKICDDATPTKCDYATVYLTVSNNNYYTITSTNPTDCGLNDGTIIINDFHSGYEYSIDNGANWSTSNTFTGLSGGTYEVIVRNISTLINYPYSQNNVILVNPPQASITNVLVTNSSSCGLNDGSITIAATGQGQLLKYSIDNGLNWQSSNVFNGLGNGTYNIAVRNANGTCIVYSSANPVILTAPNAPTITSVTPINPTNCASNNGTITISASNGTGSYQYSIDGGSTFIASNIFTNLSGGTYSICVSNNNGSCTTCYVSPIVLTNPNIPSITNIASTDPTDCSLSDGTITVTATGQTGQLLEYSIDGATTWASNNGIFTGLIDGSYTVCVSPVGGNCMTCQGVDLVSPNSPSNINVATTDPTNCTSNDGTITVTATGISGSLEYSINGGVNWMSNNTFTGLNIGSYSVCTRYSNGTCEVCETTTLTASTAPTIQSVSSTDPVDCGINNGTIVINTVGGTGLTQYSIDGGATWISNNTFTGLIGGTYMICARNIGGSCQTCNVSPTVLINPTPPVITNVSHTDPTDCGVSDGSITITANNSQSALQYSIDGGITFQASNIFSGLDASNNPYEVRVINVDGTCLVSSSNITLTEPIAPVITSVTTTDPTNCSVNDGSIVITATGQSIEYSIDSGLNWQSSNIFNGLNYGLYVVCVRNNNGTCVVTDTNNPFSIVAPNAPTITNVVKSDPIDCNITNGTITISASGGMGSYEYSIDGVNWFINAGAFTNLACGTYQPAIRNINGSCPVYYANITLIAMSNIAPVATKDSFFVDENDTLYQNVLVNDFDPDLDFLFTNTNIVSNPNNGAVQIDTLGFFTYIPNPNYFGLDTFYYELYDDGSPVKYDTGMVVINVFDVVVDPCLFGFCTPIAVDDIVSITANTPSTGDVLINDSVPNGDTLVVTTTPITSPNNGTLAINTDGTFTYTPNVGFAGTDQFVYEVCTYDGSISHCDNATVYIVVIPPPNQAPIAVDDYFAPLITVLPFNVLSNDSDPDGDNLFTDTTLVSLPLYGTISLDSLGVITYNQTTWFNGLDSFEYRVCDDEIPSLCDTGKVYILNSLPDVSIVDTTFTNATCSTPNATIEITAAGGSGNYQYSVDSGSTWQASNLFTNLDEGSYILIVSDGFRLSDTVRIFIGMLDAPSIVSTFYHSDSLVVQASSALGQNALEYTIDSGLTWQSSNTFYQISLENIGIGLRYTNGLCEVISGLTIANNPPITTDDHIYLKQEGYVSDYILFNDYDLENNALFTKPQVNYYGSDSLTLDSIGLITIPTNALTLGSYMITYETCELYNPTNCTQGTVFFDITPPTDTLLDTLIQGTTHAFCVPLTDLPGSFSTLTNLGSHLVTNNTIDSIVDNCIYLYGNTVGDDTLTVVVCDNFGFCDTTIINFYVINGVWPGDTDDDAQVDNLDLLNIGLGYGQIGTMRNTVTNVWNGYQSQEWNVSTPSSNIDYRHADANGDGMINADDTLAIVQNWQKFYIKSGNSSVLNGVPIYIDTTGAYASLPNLSLPIILGTPTNPVTGLYGAAFSYEYDTTIYETNAYIDINTSWVGSKNLDLLSISVGTPDLGRIDAAMTRIDGSNVNGIGAIAHLNMTIRDDILQQRVGFMDSLIFSFELLDVKLISNDETDIPVDILTTGFTFYTSAENVGLGQYINVFPNPVRDRITIQTERLEIESYEILDMTGRLIFNKKVTPQNIHQVNLGEIPSGIYNLKIQTNEGVANKRIVIVQ